MRQAQVPQTIDGRFGRDPSPMNENRAFMNTVPTPSHESLSTSNSNPSKDPNTQKVEPAPAKAEDTLLPTKPKHHDSVGRSWLLDITAAIFSLLCMGAVIGVLLLEDGKPIDQWSFQITPNTIISFITTLAKSSFLLVVAEALSQLKWLHFNSKPQPLSDIKLFDEASRGPLGSLNLLIRRYRSAVLASCGACIIVLALFVDPLVQLLFAFPSRRMQAPVEMGAFFQTSIVHDPHNYAWTTGGSNSRAGAVDTKMRAAILNALFNETTTPGISCPTGNCTWDSITTLGVCTGCVDIKENVTSEFLERTHTQSLWNYTLVKDVYFEASCLYDHSETSCTRWNSSATVSIEEGRGDRVAMLIALQAIRTSGGGYNEDLNLDQAVMCGSGLCAKTYKYVNVTNGVASLPTPDEDYLYILGEQTDNLSMTQEEQQKANTEGKAKYIKLTTESSQHAGGDETQYSINQADYDNLRLFLSQMYSSGWLSLGDTTRDWGDPDQHQTPVLDIGRELASSPDVNKTLRAIAEGMTEAIRTGGNSTRVPGQSYVEKVVVQIRWAWLAYPLTLMILALALLINVIWQTRRQNVVAWKGSSLALLFHNLEGWNGPLGAMRNRPELDERASRMKARLVNDANRPAFVRAD